MKKGQLYQIHLPKEQHVGYFAYVQSVFLILWFFSDRWSSDAQICGLGSINALAITTKTKSKHPLNLRSLQQTVD
jgi:hypothetical protein